MGMMHFRLNMHAGPIGAQTLPMALTTFQLFVRRIHQTLTLITRPPMLWSFPKDWTLIADFNINFYLAFTPPQDLSSLPSQGPPSACGYVGVQRSPQSDCPAAAEVFLVPQFSSVPFGNLVFVSASEVPGCTRSLPKMVLK